MRRAQECCIVAPRARFSCAFSGTWHRCVATLTPRLCARSVALAGLCPIVGRHIRVGCNFVSILPRSKLRFRGPWHGRVATPQKGDASQCLHRRPRACAERRLAHRYCSFGERAQTRGPSCPTGRPKASWFHICTQHQGLAERQEKGRQSQELQTTLLADLRSCIPQGNDARATRLAFWYTLVRSVELQRCETFSDALQAHTAVVSTRTPLGWFCDGGNRCRWEKRVCRRRCIYLKLLYVLIPPSSRSGRTAGSETWDVLRCGAHVMDSAKATCCEQLTT